MPKDKMKTRKVAASLIAPVATLLPLSVMALATSISPQMVGVDAADNAPVRASGLILFVLIPVAYLLLVLASSVVGYVLASTRKLRLKNLIIISGLVSVALGAVQGFQSPFGVKDQLIGFAVFSLFSMFSLSFGAYVWWYIAVKWHNQEDAPGQKAAR
jgi:putative Mn2+ efflux pump MntP